jgi:hypothetical protein
MESDLEEEYNNANTQIENTSNTENMSERIKQPVKNNVRNISNFLSHKSVEIGSPAKERILAKVQKQKNKYWHFQFKNDRDLDNLKKTIENIPNIPLTVIYNFEGQSHADVTLLQDNQEVGKIHFLLCDRRNSNLPEKYYIKLYFFNFKDNELFNKVKEVVTNYFNNIGINQRKEIGGKRQKTFRKKRNIKNTLKKSQKY